MKKNIKQTKNINDENSDIQEDENIPINEINNSNSSSEKKRKNKCTIKFKFFLLIVLLSIIILLIILNIIFYLRRNESIPNIKIKRQVNENINNDTDVNNNVVEIENSVKIINLNETKNVTKENESITKTILI